MSEGMLQDNEMIDVDKLDFEALGVPMARIEEAKANIAAAAGLKQAPPGSLGLPPLLDKRRIDWEIPDGAFRTAPGALFDRILLWQIPVLAKTKAESLTFGGGPIVKSDHSRSKEQREAPRGVILGAGLQALDWMRSHGCDLGHIVYFSKNTVYTVEVDYTAGKFDRLSIARGSDLILSEDLAALICSGEVRVENCAIDCNDGVIDWEHRYVDKNGAEYRPARPPAEDDL